VGHNVEYMTTENKNTNWKERCKSYLLAGMLAAGFVMNTSPTQKAIKKFEAPKKPTTEKPKTTFVGITPRKSTQELVRAINRCDPDSNLSENDSKIADIIPAIEAIITSSCKELSGDKKLNSLESLAIIGSDQNIKESLWQRALLNYSNLENAKINYYRNIAIYAHLEEFNKDPATKPTIRSLIKIRNYFRVVRSERVALGGSQKDIKTIQKSVEDISNIIENFKAKENYFDNLQPKTTPKI
jgi:hypothetical protein